MNSLEASVVPLVSPATDVPRLFKLDRRKRFACRAQLPKASSCLVSDAQQNAVASSEPASRKVMELEKNVFVDTYARAPVVIQSGKGCELYDVDGKEYPDMTAGIAVYSLGHGDPDWVNAMIEQAHTLSHVGNVYYSIPQWTICMDNAGDSWKAPPVANSGTEANEAAIKFARKFQRFSHPDKKLPATEFIAFTHSFHGRTMGSVALTSKEHYRLPFEPVMPGVKFIEYGNFEEAKKAMQHGKTAAVFIEPIQGEGGIYSATKDFLLALRTAPVMMLELSWYSMRYNVDWAEQVICGS